MTDNDRKVGVYALVVAFIVCAVAYLGYHILSSVLLR